MLGSHEVAIKQLSITKDDDAAELIQKFQEFGSEAVVMRCERGFFFTSMY